MVLIPVGDGPGQAGGFGEDPAPPAVKNVHVYFWTLLLFMYVGLAVLRVAAQDIFGGLSSVMMAVLVNIMIKNHCERMTQSCLFSFGLLCLMNFVLEAIPLALSGGNRMSQSATPVNDNGKSEDSSTSYVVTFEQHPFFDKKMGNVYILQSVALIAG